MTRPDDPTAARLRIRSRCAARSSLMANATVSKSSPSASQLIVSGDSSTLTQVIVRSRPPAPASTPPLCNPPSAIASRTVSAMGMISMPQSRLVVKHRKNRGLSDGSTNRRSTLRLVAFPAEQLARMGLTHPRSRRVRQEGQHRLQAGWYRGRRSSRPCGGIVGRSRRYPMATYTIEIPDHLHNEIQERRHLIDVAGICTEALSAAVLGRPSDHEFGQGHEVTQAINRMFGA